MPVLKNRKHELFAQELAKGKSEVEAYELAGYKPDDGNASRLTGDDRIRTRIEELLGKVADRVEVTLESLMRDAEAARLLAMKIDQPSAAVSALTARAKLAGLWIERSERTNRNVDLDALTDQQIAERLLGTNGARLALSGPEASEDQKKLH